MTSIILQTVAGINRASGGPSHSVTNLCSYLGHTGQQVHLLVIGDESDSSQWVLPDRQVVQLHCAAARKLPIVNMEYSSEFETIIRDLYKRKNLQIIHDHGMWMQNNKTSADMAKCFNVPLVVSPRGMLEPWALKYHWWKKKPVWWGWQKAAIERAALLHATAKEEAENFRRLGLKNPIAVIPNGVDVPEISHREQKEFKTALFLSRIHPKKGLINLVNAWAKVKPSNWRMVVAGPSEGHHKDEVKRSIESAGLADQFEFLGPVNGQQKWDLYQHADIFILPTFSENFGIVIAEALAAEVPVITTKGAPWKDLELHRCGWWIDIGVEPLAEAIKDATSLSTQQRHEMGQRGRRLVEHNYSWDKIGEEMLSVYEWVLNGGNQPDCVITE